MQTCVDLAYLENTEPGISRYDQRRYRRVLALRNLPMHTYRPARTGHRSTAPRVRVEDGRARGEHELRVGWRQERGLCFLLTFFSNFLFFCKL